MTVQEIHAIRDRILDHREINRTEALSLMAIDPQDTDALKALYEGANEIREKFQGPFFDLCSIMNVKSGKCSEDCRFCAQSIHFETPAESFDLVHVDAIIGRAKEMEEEGVHRFSLVSSGKGIDDQDFENLLHIYQRLSSETTLKLCASHGIIDEAKARRLKEAGVMRYHHNLETSRAFYSEICTTHGFQERIETIEACKAAGLEVCSGGIIGLGESIEDRMDMALELKAMNIDSIPINILNPIPGTPMEGHQPLSESEILKTVAVYRFIHPNVHIRYAGGRNMLGDAFIKGYHGGINGVLTGNLLTTTGKNIAEDKQIILESNFTLGDSNS